MKRWILANPELAGLLVGLSDAPLRAVVASIWVPSKGEFVGPFIVGNVHHHVGIRALGLGTLQWFGIAAVLLVLFYAYVRFCEHLARRDYSGFRMARAGLAAMCGVLVLNTLEAVATGKVTDYIGIADGNRAHVANWGDAVVTIGAATVAFSLILALVQYFRDPHRRR